jgi:WD40 repeat protein
MNPLLNILLKSAIFFMVIGTSISQSLQIISIDTTNFPIITAKFYAIDSSGKQITKLLPSDFIITENGINVQALNISCPINQTQLPISSVITIDASGSMWSGRIDIAKAAARAWINAMNLNNSECAITTFGSDNNIIQDFTNDRDLLLSKLDYITQLGGTDYNAALIDPPAGAVLVAKAGQYKRVILFLSDGEPNFPPNETSIIEAAIENNISIYCLTIELQAPSSMKDFSEQTGGQWFEQINTADDAVATYLKILQFVQNLNPCEISWRSNVKCDSSRNQVSLNLVKNHTSASFSYTPPYQQIANLAFNPVFMGFINVPPGKRKDNNLLIIAQNSDFNVTQITSSNTKFTISPQNFNLKKGDSVNLTVSYFPTDSSYDFANFTFLNNLCTKSLAAYGSFLGKKPKIKTLKLTSPNGWESFIAGSDTIISWSGVPDMATVSLLYSTDNGTTYNKIIDDAFGLKYLWKNIPKPVSNNCLVWVKQYEINQPGIFNLKNIFSGHNNFVVSVGWSPDGYTVVSGSNDSTIKLWSTVTGSIINTFSRQNNAVFCVEWKPDGTQIASAIDTKVKIWDASSGSLLTSFGGNNAIVSSVSWNQDGSSVVSGSYNGKINVYNSASGSIIYTLTGHSGVVYSVRFSPDGSKIVSGSSDNTIKIWDALTGSLIRTITGHTGYINCVGWSPDGLKVVSGSSDSTVRVWDVATGVRNFMFRGHSGQVMSVDWSPDGYRIVSGSNDKSIKIWNVETGANDFTLTGHKDIVYSVKWNPDGWRLASGSYDNTVRVWFVGGRRLIQDDVSDSVFSIVAPSASAQDVDMKQCLVGSTKDSMITDFIINTGQFKIGIDSIYFVGANASQFKIVGGIPPFSLDSGTSQTVGFSFTPISPGIKTAQIKIITQFDTITQMITGEGVLPLLQIVSKLIDFGRVTINKTKDTTVCIVLKNNGTTPISVHNTYQKGPDLNQFLIKNGGGSFVLYPDSVHSMVLTFAPTATGRTSGSIAFDHNGIGSPAVVQLFGDGRNPPILTAHNLIKPFNILCTNQYIDSFLIKNTGDNELILSNSIFQGKDSSRFTILSPSAFPFSIEPQDSSFFVVRFLTDSTVGYKSTVLNIENNTDINPFTVSISGRSDSISLKINNYDYESDTIVVYIGTICPGTSFDTTITLYNKSSVGTTVRIEKPNSHFQIDSIEKPEKKDAPLPLSGSKKKEKKK